MNRVMIIGCSGAGKSTLARKLQEKTGLPLYHLDLIWHNPDKTHISREEFDRRLLEITAREKWILDGNYARTLELRLQRCELVILLDYPLETCLSGVTGRMGKPRPDMPWTETEPDPEFTQWIQDFEYTQMPQMLPLLEKYRKHCQIKIFKTRWEADAFLETLM